MQSARIGFTLLEVLLVLAIIVVLGVLAYPSLEGMYSSYKLSAAADQLRAAWASGRAHAVNEGRPYRFAVLPGTGNFRLAPDSPEFWSGSTDLMVAEGPENPPLILEDALPRGVRFSTAEAALQGGQATTSDTVQPVGTIDPNLWEPILQFLPDATTREDLEIWLTAPGSRPLILRQRALTGVVTVRQYGVEGSR